MLNNFIFSSKQNSVQIFYLWYFVEGIKQGFEIYKSPIQEKEINSHFSLLNNDIQYITIVEFLKIFIIKKN